MHNYRVFTVNENILHIVHTAYPIQQRKPRKHFQEDNFKVN